LIANNDGEAHTLNFTGDDGELTEIVVNHMRNIGEYMFNMTTSTRPALETRAVNTDFRSQVQTKLGNGLLDYYMREKKLEKYLKQACNYSIVLGSGWVKLNWNARLGSVTNQEEIDTAKNEKLAGKKVDIPQPEYEGDLEYHNLSPFDVVEDLNKENEDHDWRIARTFKNKFDLIATYPEYKEEILKVDTSDKYKDSYISITKNSKTESDDIPVWEFYHRKSESMPEGRYILFVSEDAILYDGPLPYRRIPLFPMKPSRVMGTPLGYTILFDLLPMQEATNALYSTILTNQMAFGVQNILVPSNAGVEPSQIAGGLNILKYNPQSGGKPEALQLTSTPKEVFDFLQMLITAMETVSGINATIRGNPEANIRSAAAMAMVESNAIQYMSGLQSEYVHLMEDIGLATIETLIDFADSPRIASIVGASDRAYTATFKGTDLSEINRVVVDVANPLTKTVAGKVNAADNLLQYGEITSKQYMNIMSTGKLEVGTDGVVHEQMLIQSENEGLMRGEEQLTLAIDQHLEHIKGHRSLFSDPILRQEGELVQLALAHINEHIEALRTTDPELLMSLGEQPLQPQQPAGAPPATGQPPQAPPEGGEAVPQAPQDLPAEEQAMQNQGGRVQGVNLPESMSDMPLSMEQQLEQNMGAVKPEGVE